MGDLRAPFPVVQLATAPGFRAGCNSLHARPRPGRCGSFLPHPGLPRRSPSAPPATWPRTPPRPHTEVPPVEVPPARLHAGHRMSIASPLEDDDAALTIRFCFPPTSSSPSRIRTGLRPTFSSPQKGYRTALAHLGDPRGPKPPSPLQQVQFREAVRPFGKNQRHPEAKTPNGRSTRAKFLKTVRQVA